jgi:hypothetical protein
MTLKKEKILPIFAMFILMIGTITNIYVHAQKPQTTESNETLIINGLSIDINELFSMMQLKTIETDDGEKIGIPVDEMIQRNGITCPSCHSYTFIALDGYQRTVTWEYMQNGVFTEDSQVFFKGLPHAFWVSDIIEIKVN